MKTLSEIKEQIKILETEAYKLKTKAARQKRYAKARELRREAWSMLHEQCKNYGTMSVKATVKHFNPRDEHFLVETPYGNMWLSPCSDELTKSWYSHTCCIEYTQGQTIVVEIDTEVNMDGLFLQLIPKHHRGGRVNETQYAELCKRDDLAFFKYPNSNGVTGLFKQVVNS